MGGEEKKTRPEGSPDSQGSCSGSLAMVNKSGATLASRLWFEIKCFLNNRKVQLFSNAGSLQSHTQDVITGYSLSSQHALLLKWYPVC